MKVYLDTSSLFKLYKRETGSEEIESVISNNNVADIFLSEITKQLIFNYGVTGLRTLDSIQLASAIEVKSQIDKYFTSDKLLHLLFEKESLPV